MVNQGNWIAQKIKNIRKLTPDEEHELLLQYQNGDESAGRKVIEHNLSWCMWYANKYVSKHFPFDEAFDASLEGMYAALKHFDAQKHKVRFASYAQYWQRQQLRRNKTKAVRKWQEKSSNFLHDRDENRKHPYSDPFVQKQFVSHEEELLFCGDVRSKLERAPDRVRKIIENYLNGKNYEQQAEEAGVTRQAMHEPVRQWLKAGCPPDGTPYRYDRRRYHASKSVRKSEG